ncbi:MAG: 50S ribosomal protein L4 [Candidatus Peribacteraceae bacterium]|nr:50S ribosomal protein L4 [Candidatus Peribacteraceae bacterium]
MLIDVYTATGEKKGTVELPKTLFDAPINEGLMHQALVRQQSNRRASTAHVKTRAEVSGSTRKLFSQKGTGRARRGSLRSPVLRGGGKAFGPRNVKNYVKDMPQKMRQSALKSCLSLQAQKKAIIGLEGSWTEVKSRKAAELLGKLPVELGRKILLVTADVHRELKLSTRNIPRVKVITAAYLNPEDVLGSRHIIFLVDALAKAEEVFAAKAKPLAKKESKEFLHSSPSLQSSKKTAKTTKKAPPKKTSK